MIGTKKAFRHVLKAVPPPRSKFLSLADCLGKVLARDLRARLDLPRFDNSAMDGYALDAGQTRHATESRSVDIQIVGVCAAGDRPIIGAKNKAYRIYTGAPLPKSCDSVIVQELAEIRGGKLIVNKPVKLGRHVRLRGEEIIRGHSLMPRGTRLDPAGLGYLASQGFVRVPVWPSPKTSLIISGSELRQPGETLEPGAIYDGNGISLKAALRYSGASDPALCHTNDNLALLKKALGQALEESDLVLLSGGVSVGDRDYGREALKDLGVKTIFWGVSQKPGKPLFFGRKGKKAVFGLPGNPVSANVCFQIYVSPWIHKFMGQTLESIQSFPLGQKVQPDPKKTLFVSGQIHVNGRGPEIFPRPDQGSHRLSSLAGSHGLLEIPPGHKSLAEGTEIRFHPLKPALFLFSSSRNRSREKMTQ